MTAPLQEFFKIHSTDQFGPIKALIERASVFGDLWQGQPEPCAYRTHAACCKCGATGYMASKYLILKDL